MVSDPPSCLPLCGDQQPRLKPQEAWDGPALLPSQHASLVQRLKSSTLSLPKLTDPLKQRAEPSQSAKGSLAHKWAPTTECSLWVAMGHLCLFILSPVAAGTREPGAGSAKSVLHVWFGAVSPPLTLAHSLPITSSHRDILCHTQPPSHPHCRTHGHMAIPAGARCQMRPHGGMCTRSQERTHACPSVHLAFLLARCLGVRSVLRQGQFRGTDTSNLSARGLRRPGRPPQELLRRGKGAAGDSREGWGGGRGPVPAGRGSAGLDSGVGFSPPRPRRSWRRCAPYGRGPGAQGAGPPGRRGRGPRAGRAAGGAGGGSGCPRVASGAQSPLTVWRLAVDWGAPYSQPSGPPRDRGASHVVGGPGRSQARHLGGPRAPAAVRGGR